MKTKKAEIEEILEELKQATLATLEIDERLIKVHAEKQRAQKRLSMARDAFYSIRTTI